MHIIEKAAQVAAQAHKEQQRKHDGSPYIAHPIMVAMKIMRHGFSDEIVAAALIHDVVEDSDWGIDRVRSEFGDEIAQMVSHLSEDTSLEWELRKEKYTDAIAAAPEGTKAISVADKIHNAENLIETHGKIGSDIWNNFNRGKDKKVWFEKLLLSKLQKNWQHPMLEEYAALVSQMEKLD